MSSEDRLRLIEEEGRNCRLYGDAVKTNPYSVGWLHDAWERGWRLEDTTQSTYTDASIIGYLRLFDDNTYGMEIQRELAKLMEARGLIEWMPPKFGTTMWAITDKGKALLAAAPPGRSLDVWDTKSADRIDGYDRDDLGESPDY